MTFSGAPQGIAFEGHQIATWIIGEGPDLVLIHGTPFSSHVWHQIAPALAKHYRVHMFDMLGYGQSDMPDGDVSLGVQNELLAFLFAHWGLTRPNVLAHDFGGATALRAHFLNNLEYRHLLLVDPVALRPWGSAFVAHVRQHEMAFAGVPDYLHRAILAAYIRTASRKTLSDEDLASYIRPWLGELRQPAFYRQIAQMDMRFTDQVEQDYPRLRCPSTLLWGQQDQWIPIETGRKLATILPVCDFHEIPSSGHLMQEDAPERIVQAAFQAFGG